MERGARWATVHEVTKSWTQLSTHIHSAHLERAMVILPIIQADGLKTGAYKQDIRTAKSCLPDNENQ